MSLLLDKLVVVILGIVIFVLVLILLNWKTLKDKPLTINWATSEILDSWVSGQSPHS